MRCLMPQALHAAKKMCDTTSGSSSSAPGSTSMHQAPAAVQGSPNAVPMQHLHGHALLALASLGVAFGNGAMAQDMRTTPAPAQHAFQQNTGTSAGVDSPGRLEDASPACAWGRTHSTLLYCAAVGLVECAKEMNTPGMCLHAPLPGLGPMGQGLAGMVLKHAIFQVCV